MAITRRRSKPTTRPDYPLMGDVEGMLLEEGRVSAGTRCLDIGTGESRLPWRLKRQGCEVVSVDVVSKKGTNIARRGSKGVRVISSNVLDLNPAVIGEYDRVFASLLLLYVSPDDLSRFWAVVKSLTRRGGLVLCVDVHPCSKVSLRQPGWRRLLTRQGYWESGQVSADIIVDEGRAQRTVYWHHTFEEIFAPALAIGMRLCRFVEFPRYFHDRAQPVPGYVLSVWGR